jgi:hypothetical protein
MPKCLISDADKLINLAADGVIADTASTIVYNVDRRLPRTNGINPLFYVATAHVTGKFNL